LWNITCDGILSISKPRGVELHSFANDIAATAVAKTILKLQDIAVECMLVEVK